MSYIPEHYGDLVRAIMQDTGRSSMEDEQETRMHTHLNLERQSSLRTIITTHIEPTRPL